MELIIKPTDKCNFACTFCSSPTLARDSKTLLSQDYVFQFLKRFPETNTIIVNGGDPLMVDPDYYWAILNFIEKNNLPTNLSFTTNLWAFFRSPEKWQDIFRHPQVGVATSFNYGETRRITREKVFTEDIFWEISNLFLERIGYRPDFISVITEENKDSAIQNVELAKRMNVECKLNYALASGKQSRPFLKASIYKIYLEIIDRGLHPWEYNSKQLLNKSKSLSTTCPLNRSCDSNIRCLQPDGDYYSCGAFGDDKEYPISFEAEMSNADKFLPLSSQLELISLKNECLSCPLFNICNGCKKTIKDYKRHNLVEEHCSSMQKLLPRLQELLGGIDQYFN